jgi:hypothetical protein
MFLDAFDFMLGYQLTMLEILSKYILFSLSHKEMSTL